MKIKCIFPHNYSIIRNVKIFLNGKTASVITYGEEIELPLKVGDKVEFKLAYYFKAKIKIQESDIDKNLIVFYKFRDNFLLAIVDSFNPSLLQVKSFNDTDYDNVVSILYPENEKALNYKYDMMVVIFSFAIGLFFLGHSIFLSKQENLKDFEFLVGGINILAVVILLFNKGKICFNDYKMRIIAFCVLNLGTALFLDIEYIYKFLLVAVILSVLIRILSQSLETS